MKKYAPKIVSAALSLMLVLSIVATTAYTAGAENSSANSDTNASEKSKGDLFKEESVYVISDAEGNPDKIIVSDWIKNPDKLNTISDKSNLSDIKNVKGDETYKLNPDNMCVWNAEGNDIYYQGTSDADLPVDLRVSYIMDGRAMSPKEIAGKSGKVTIRFDYKNKQYETVKIDGREERIYVPFVMLTGMMLDNEKFSNVSVSSGKVINDGNHTIVAGFAMPGMEDNLDLDLDKLRIPDYVEITADVKDFELSTTLTVATSDMFSDIDFTDVDKTVDDLNEKLDSLTDATNKLVDGSSKLYDGISTLLNKSGSLISGVQALADGAEKLSKGASELDKGAGKLQKGAKKLDKGAASLKTGAAKMQSGLSELANGLGQLSSNSSALTGGAKEVFNTLLSTADKQIAAAGLKADKLTIENYSKVLSDIVKSLNEDDVRKLAEKAARESVEQTVRSQEELIKAGVAAAVKEQVLEGVLKAAGLNMTPEQYSEAVQNGSIPAETQAQINGAVEQKMKTDEIESTINTQTEQQIQNLIDTNMKSEAVQTQIEQAVQTAKAGAASISALKKQLDSFNEFYQGIITYTSGVDSASGGANQLSEGSEKLTGGTKELKNGTKQLRKGASDLKNGTSQLASGSRTLYNGVNQLNNGTGALVDGVKLLDEGALTLRDGIKKYKQEGIDVLVDAIDGKAETLINRLKAISKVSKHYNSFSGIADDMDGKVNFIYKTDSVETK
ncbi:MAG: hypothetical protein K6F88_07480 [Ruminococcus sp.]|nr:hypothetical protein [Ruminococcus sp.]